MKIVSMILVSLGIIILVLGALLYVKPDLFSLFSADTTPPVIFWSFPYDGFVGTSVQLKEICVIVQDDYPNVTVVDYADDANYKNGLILSKAKTAMAITDYKIKYPDPTHDGAIDEDDVEYVRTRVGSTDLTADFVEPWGKVDLADLTYIIGCCYTYIFTAPYLGYFSTPQLVKYNITSLDWVGNLKTHSGHFEIVESIGTLLGNWYINDNSVSENTTIKLESNTASIKFVSTEDVNANAKVIIEGVSFNLTKTATKTWTTTVTLNHNSYIQLIALTSDNLYINSVVANVQIQVPSMPYLSIAMIGIGSVLIAIGVLIEKREQSRIIY